VAPVARAHAQAGGDVDALPGMPGLRQLESVGVMPKFHQALRDILERNALVLEWLDLVPWAIYEKRPRLSRIARLLGYQDAMQEGRLALLRAAELWDSGKGTFSTYAVKCIRCRLLGKAERLREQPLAVTPRRLRGVEGSGQADLERHMRHVEQAEALAPVLKSLLWREREILRLRFGLDGNYCYTLEEIGEIFRLSPERVRQTVAKAIRKLQHPVRSQRLESLIPEKIEEAPEQAKKWELPWHLRPIPKAVADGA
jgi:RNA polymerase sigma factor (sigma-70 family)